ncbi:hypothetical protein ACFORL_06035 [Legionella dresdenensis]|uniref:Uncharacterized protein n=1 Tax=Legionella dresdenensis TaxID=450200 RepID=A0ABV8CF92_9GAMM
MPVGVLGRLAGTGTVGNSAIAGTIAGIAVRAAGKQLSSGGVGVRLR